MSKEVILHDLIKKCLLNPGKTGTCVLITGPHGSGKSFLIKKTIESFAKKFSIINFPGTLARHSLTADPSKELLKLLLLATCKENRRNKVSQKSSVESLEEFFETWPSETSRSNSKVLLIIEDIDLIAGSISQQSLLYTIFEATNNKPLVIIGTTHRIDFLELLEKRVKSRIGYNVIGLERPSFEEFERWRGFSNSEKVDKTISSQQYQMRGDPRSQISDSTCATNSQLSSISSAELLVIAFEALIDRGLIMEKKEASFGDLYQKTCFLTIPQYLLRDVIDKSQTPHLQAIIKE